MKIVLPRSIFQTFHFCMGFFVFNMQVVDFSGIQRDFVYCIVKIVLAILQSMAQILKPLVILVLAFSSFL